MHVPVHVPLTHTRPASGVDLPETDYSALDACMLRACAATNLQPTDVFVEKAHQLYEMILVRHGLMVVGYSFAAKTAIARWGCAGKQGGGRVVGERMPVMPVRGML